MLIAELLSGLAWMQGAAAVGTDRGADTSLTLFPGSRVHHLPTADGLSVGWQPGWLCLAAGLLVFLVVIKPWRLVARPTAGVA